MNHKELIERLRDTNKHTPEPWEYWENDRTGFGVKMPRKKKTRFGAEPYAVIGGFEQEDRAEMKANARRIVACVNACAGCATEVLETAPVGFFNSTYGHPKYLEEITKQRDELLAALGSGGRHCNDDTPHSDLCEAIIDSKEADLGQGLDPFWKWAFRRGFHEAETSYKVDIATLEQQRDELMAALEKMNRAYVILMESARDRICDLGGECDGIEVMERNDPYLRESRAAIASVKEKK